MPETLRQLEEELLQLLVVGLDALIGHGGRHQLEADPIERTLGQIARSPQSGSLRFAYELEIPGLRVRPIARFPHLVFYVTDEDVVDVWRVLHTKRDFPSAIADEIAD